MTTESWQPSGDVAGLTDRPRLPRLGKIHLGIKKLSQRGAEYPSATDYLVVPEIVQSIYGPKPQELDVVFPSDDISRVAGVSWKQYSMARGKICWGDGEHAIRSVDLDLIDPSQPHGQDDYDAAIVNKDSKKVGRAEIPCPAKECVFAQRGLCKPVMNLMFLLPKVPGIGVFQLDTGSINSILDVRGGIQLVMQLSGGRLAGIPLKLRIEPMEVISPEDQKKKIVHTLKLISPATLGKVLLAGERNLRELLMADEGPSRSMGLPELTDGSREVPTPAEPEEDLYPASVVGEAGRVVDVPLRAGNSPQSATHQVEDAGSAPAPRSEMEAAFTDAARFTQLLDEMHLPKRERETWERIYKGRPAAGVKFLEDQFAKRQAAAKAR